jgi:hypothetical protein
MAVSVFSVSVQGWQHHPDQAAGNPFYVHISSGRIVFRFEDTLKKTRQTKMPEKRGTKSHKSVFLVAKSHGTVLIKEGYKTGLDGQ